ncbi:MAG: magnesium transporter [Bacilli bacterium]|nr:magnesium transporter [Bacilli bacterium]
MEDIVKKIIEDINSNDGQDLKNAILDYHPYDVANALKEVDDDTRDKVFSLLSPGEAADIFEYYETDEAADILEDFDAKTSSEIISNMELDDAVDVLNEIDEDKKEEIVQNIDKDVKEDILEASKYDENMAGSIMTDNFLSLDVNMNVGQAMQHVVKESNEQEVIDVLFVLDNDCLVGTLELRDLIIARKMERIADLMDKNFKSIQATDNITDATSIIKEYNLLALPVLEDKKLLGIITIDDAIDVVDEMNKDDYDKMAGLVGTNTISFKDVIKSRLLWLIILLALSFIVSSVMDGFSQIIASITPLVFFQSLILDMGGNAGTQSLATTVVEISDSALDTRKKVRKHLWRELRAGLLNSVILGIAAFALSFVFILARGISVEGISNISLSLVIGLAMASALLISNFIGSLVPIILYKFHIDPAVASGPFITTLNDIISVSIYYSLAYVILIVGGGL